MNANPSKAIGPIIVWAIILLVTLPVIYVLSYGPAAGLWCRGYISPRSMEVFYYPLGWIGQRYTAVMDALFWYESFFRNDLPPR